MQSAITNDGTNFGLEHGLRTPNLRLNQTKTKCFGPKLEDGGDFQLDFLSISHVVNHMNCYKFECSH